MNKKAIEALIKYLPSYSVPLKPISLREGDFYSIWGVMCDIYRRAEKKGRWEDKINLQRFVTDMGPWCITLPTEVKEWYGLSDSLVDRLLQLEFRGGRGPEFGKMLEEELKRCA